MYNFDEIAAKLAEYKSQNKRIFSTCSFQTHSLVLLHIISRIDKTIPVYFIDTGYHFPETVLFKEQVGQLFDIQILDVRSPISKAFQTDGSGNLLFTADPDHCCYINKVQPVDGIMLGMDVWINGVRGDQNANRKNLQVEEKAKYGVLRYHPMLSWTSKMIYEYRKAFNLPENPLEAKGYLSIGCEPCTRKYLGGDERGGRWFGMKKTECGLNTELIGK